MDPKDTTVGEAEGKADKAVLEEANDLQATTLEKSRLDWFFNEIFPIRNFNKFLSKKDVMNLRRVCEDWRVTVDNVLETANDFKEPNYKSYESIITSPTLLFKKAGDISKPLVLVPNIIHSSSLVPFWKSMERHPRSPFLSKLAYFRCMFDDDRYYWAHISAMLDRYGEELRSMCIHYRSELGRAEMLRLVQECLIKTPQLTILDCFFANLSPEADASNQVVFPDFPPLPNLKELSICFRQCPFFKQISVYFEQLVSLDVRFMEDFMDSFDPRIHSTFPCLRYLAVSVRNEVGLYQLQSFTSELKEVYLNSTIPDNLCLSVYFRFLEHFKKTLSVIKIERKLNCAEEMLPLETLGIPEPPTLDIPNLKVLSLSIMRCGFGGMDPILKLTGPPDYLELGVIPCHCLVGEGGQNGQRIQLDLEDMYKSTIWDLLPLQKIVVEPLELLKLNGDRDRYTRTMYELQRQNGNPKAAKQPRLSLCI